MSSELARPNQVCCGSVSPLHQFPIYRFPVFLSYVAITMIMMMIGDKTVEAELV